jgi:hypothetical protein
MNETAEELRSKMKALHFPDGAVPVPATWSGRPARPRPSLDVTDPSPAARRQLPGSLVLLPTFGGGDRFRCAPGTEEQVIIFALPKICNSQLAN